MANPKGNIATLKPFKPKWSAGETKVIRVPAYLADRLLRYGHELDNRKDKRDRHILTSDDVRALLQVVDNLHEVLDFPRNSFSKPRKDFVREQIRELMRLIPGDTRQRDEELLEEEA